MHNNRHFIDDGLFSQIIENIPLVSLDLVIKNPKDEILLGKRSNKPAKGYWFTIGGRILKNEKIHDAAVRIASEELNITLKSTPIFLGVFEHFYDDAIYNGIETHYINLVYTVQVDSIPNLPMEQHEAYRWFEINALLSQDMVHPYIKDIFKKGEY